MYAPTKPQVGALILTTKSVNRYTGKLFNRDNREAMWNTPALFNL